MINLDLSPLLHSDLVLVSARKYAGHDIKRYTVPGVRLDKAAGVINSLVTLNYPNLIFVNVNPRVQGDDLKNHKYLVINGNKLCMTDKEQAPEDISTICRDVSFTDGYITDPVKCQTNGVIFEKAFFDIWLRAKGNCCPCDGSHPIDIKREDPYLKQEIEDLKKRYAAQEEKIKELVLKVKQMESSTKVTETLITAFDPYLITPTSLSLFGGGVHIPVPLLIGKVVETSARFLESMPMRLVNLPVIAFAASVTLEEEKDTRSQMITHSVAHQMLCLDHQKTYTQKEIDAVWETVSNEINPDKTKLNMQKWIDECRDFLYTHYGFTKAELALIEVKNVN